MTRKIILSIHDSTPKFETQIKKIIKELDRLEIKKREIFMITNWEEKYPLEKESLFNKLILNSFSKDQINLHGLTHYSKTGRLIDKLIFGKNAKSVEFYGLNHKEIDDRFKSAIKSIRKNYEVSPKIFIPPRWENSKKIKKICKENGISYTEDKFYLINLDLNKKKFSFPICYDNGDNVFLNRAIRYYNRMIISISYVLKLPVRYSIHPEDIDNGNFKIEMRLLERLKRKWEFVSTEEFWKLN